MLLLSQPYLCFQSILFRGYPIRLPLLAYLLRPTGSAYPFIQVRLDGDITTQPFVSQHDFPPSLSHSIPITYVFSYPLFIPSLAIDSQEFTCVLVLLVCPSHHDAGEGWNLQKVRCCLLLHRP
uniref:Uncharacterized protein n=1 Tax=Picea glauca TaxID=3330 RepID=A0A101LYN4_PICGL|nr:hypothetical protein ABT39_MTgene5943 [Picea glauca]